MSHKEPMLEAGAEAVELIMWLIMRGALSNNVRRVHRSYYAPMTTGMGLITFEDPAENAADGHSSTSNRPSTSNRRSRNAD